MELPNPFSKGKLDVSRSMSVVLIFFFLNSEIPIMEHSLPKSIVIVWVRNIDLIYRGPTGVANFIITLNALS